MELIGTTAATTLVDTQASGGIEYSYIVRAVVDCGTEATDSNCALATTTGSCHDQPLFGGVESVVNDQTSSCGITLGWSAATPQCGTSTRYNVYRSTTPGFSPGPAQLVESCVDGTNWTDSQAESVRLSIVCPLPEPPSWSLLDQQNGIISRPCRRVVSRVFRTFS